MGAHLKNDIQIHLNYLAFIKRQVDGRTKDERNDNRDSPRKLG
jgi:hypothetical protein